MAATSILKLSRLCQIHVKLWFKGFRIDFSSSLRDLCGYYRMAGDAEGCSCFCALGLFFQLCRAIDSGPGFRKICWTAHSRGLFCFHLSGDGFGGLCLTGTSCLCLMGLI